MSKTQHLYHVVFATKKRQKTISIANKRALYHEIYDILQENGCYVYRINGMEDHVHIFFALNPNILLKDIVKEVKGKSSYWMKRSGLFPNFTGWCKEYFGVSKGAEQIPAIVNYITNQERHHLATDLASEMAALYASAQLSWHPADLL